MAKHYDGKAVVVTGAGGDAGIGRAIALAFADEGASVVVNDFGTYPDGRKMADTVVELIRSKGGKAVPNYDSVASMEGSENIIHTCVEAYGRIDVLINCAGVHVWTPPLEATKEQFDFMVSVNLLGTFALDQACAKQMVKQGNGGSIVNFSSRSAFGAPGADGNQVLYGMTKAGILGITHHVAVNFEKYGIIVNDILPEAVSKMNASAANDPSADMGDGVPISTSPRTPEHVAAVVLYLASDTAIQKKITGKHVAVTGADFTIYAPPLNIKGESARFFRNGSKEPWAFEDLDTIPW